MEDIKETAPEEQQTTLLSDMLDAMKTTPLIDPGPYISDNMTPETIAKVTNGIAQLVANAKDDIDSFNNFLSSAENFERNGGFKNAEDLQKQIAASYAFMVKAALEIEKIQKQVIFPLLPYLQQALIEEQDAGNPIFNGWTLDNVLHCLSITGDVIDETVRPIYEEAKKRQDAPRVNAIQTDKEQYPLDKPNHVIWNLIKKADQNGQLKLDLSRKLKITTDAKSNPQGAYVIFTVNFEDLAQDVKTTRQLTPYDKRVQIACAALWNAGNYITTLTQIYYKMGYTSKPNKATLQKIADSLTKQRAAQIFIDNIHEAKVYEGYARFRYEGALLPSEIISAYVNDVYTDAAVHFFREPPMITFARDRKQITTINQRLLETPGSKTDASLKLEDYLIDRIGHMKNPKCANRKILFSTLFKECNLTSEKQKKRAPEKIKGILDHYQKCEWIKGYSGIDGNGKKTANGITIDL